MYIIKNKETGYYWNNENGWIEHKCMATKFSYREKVEFNLPIDGEWFSKKKA